MSLYSRKQWVIVMWGATFLNKEKIQTFFWAGCMCYVLQNRYSSNCIDLHVSKIYKTLGTLRDICGFLPLRTECKWCSLQFRHYSFQDISRNVSNSGSDGVIRQSHGFQFFLCSTPITSSVISRAQGFISSREL